MSGQRVALVITTGVFADPGLRSLRSPAQDAAGMVEVLGDQAIGGFDVTEVSDKSHHEVRQAIGTFLDGRSSDDVVVIYVSTHGLKDRWGRLHLAGVDTTKAGVLHNGVSWGWIIDVLDDCDARQQVVILDCCYSGAVNRTKGDGDITSALGFDETAKGRVIFTASGAAEYSYEGESIDATMVAASVYTAGLIEGLRSGDADTNGDGTISVAEAHEYAVKHVIAVSAKQKPTWNTQRAEGNIILARNPKGATVTPALIPEALQRALDNQYPAVRKGAVEELGGWLRSDDPGRALTARTQLTRIAADDIPAVGRLAQQLLGDLLSMAAPPGADGPSEAPEAAMATVSRFPGSSRTIRASPNRFLGGIDAVAFSPDGTLLATGSVDKTVRLWHPTTGEHVRTLTGHTLGVMSAAFSPDGSLLATGSLDKSVRLWQVTNGEYIRTLTGHTGGAMSVTFSRDGSLLVTGGHHDSVRLWQLTTVEHVRTLTGHNWVLCVALSPDGTLLATGSDDQTVRLWDPTVGEHVRTLTGHHSPVACVAFSPDGTLLATGSRDCTVRLWHPTTGDHVRTLAGHTLGVTSAAFSPDGSLLATGSFDKTVRLWHPTTGEHLRTLTGHTSGVMSVTFNPDGTLLASGSSDKTVRLWT